ncbi:hypothetical protein [Phytoactinopolyspora mesophila]|uniref:hypothetical protein n=1 Tax=Phytoactinopolyspora mesophila TaxID=2650750 RepID=UPI001391586A|nr:hypothetical protein [Phytoactinopolyspora mesophila]
MASDSTPEVRRAFALRSEGAAEDATIGLLCEGLDRTTPAQLVKTAEHRHDDEDDEF